MYKGGSEMRINGRWYTEPEIEAYIEKLRSQISQRDKLLSSVRSYYKSTESWDELFEEDYQRLATDSNVGGENGGDEK